MAESLVARGHHVEVISYHLGQKLADLPFAVHRIARIPTYTRVAPGPSYQKLLVVDPLLAAKVYAVARSGRFDIIHAHHYEGMLAALPAARQLHIPLVFDVHTLLASELPHYSLGLPAAILRGAGEGLDRLIPRRADHIVAVTRAIRHRLMHELGIPAGKVTTVYTGAEADHFQEALKAEWPEAPRTLIYTGTLEGYQRIDLMLAAFRKVIDKRPDVRLKIVSDASLDDHRDLIERLQLGGNIDLVRASYFELPMQLHSAMIALSPRVECDGLPVKVLNYMATGRAIVAFEGSAEAIQDGVSGVKVRNHDVDGFGTAILDLLNRPERVRELGRNARRRVEEFFVWESAARLLEEIYGGLLAAKGPG